MTVLEYVIYSSLLKQKGSYIVSYIFKKMNLVKYLATLIDIHIA